MNRLTAGISRTNSVMPADTPQKVPKYGVFSGLYFPEFGRNMEIYTVNYRIESEFGKIRARKNSVFGHFSHSKTSFKEMPNVKNKVWNTIYSGTSR